MNQQNLIKGTIDKELKKGTNNRNNNHDAPVMKEQLPTMQKPEKKLKT